MMEKKKKKKQQKMKRKERKSFELCRIYQNRKYIQIYSFYTQICCKYRKIFSLMLHFFFFFCLISFFLLVK
ncbi:uncharacterized protein DS421_10g309860 [Arachis hypogaea]|nr:uncharacterized protein DS421_10g309860 [Arachis hypogaea]